MRRLVRTGLVPCPPAELAAHVLAGTSPADAWNGVAGGRLRAVTPTELLVTRGHGAWTVHRFLPASGGCLWAVESHDRPRPEEPWTRFCRRRLGALAEIEQHLDRTAGHFAARS